MTVCTRNCTLMVAHKHVFFASCIPNFGPRAPVHLSLWVNISGYTEACCLQKCADSNSGAAWSVHSGKSLRPPCGHYLFIRDRMSDVLAVFVLKLVNSIFCAPQHLSTFKSYSSPELSAECFLSAPSVCLSPQCLHGVYETTLTTITQVIPDGATFAICSSWEGRRGVKLSCVYLHNVSTILG